MGTNVIGLSLAIACASCSLAAAQTQTFRSRADLVQVPVIVQDKHGYDVHGLAAGDFVLEQDGKVQTIAQVEEVTAGTAAAAPVAAKAGIFTNKLVSAQQPQEVVIVALDLMMTPFLDNGRTREALLKFLTTQMKPNVAIGLVAIKRGEVSMLHSFTSSPTELSEALQKVTGITSLNSLADTVTVRDETHRLEDYLEREADVNESSRQIAQRRIQYDVATDLESLRVIAHWVGGIPGRKVLIWATADIPLPTLMSPDGKPHAGAPRVYYENYEWTMRTLANNNVALYPVDVRGIVPAADAASMGSGGAPSEFAPPVMSGMAGSDISARSRDLQAGVQHLSTTNHFAMEMMAAATGGRAFFNRNEIAKSFADALEDSNHYYMLSYYIDRSQTRAGWHALKVSVRRNDAKARTRTGFFSDEPGGDTAVLNADEQTALVSPFTYTAVPMTLEWTDVAQAKHAGATEFKITIPASAAFADISSGVLDFDVLTMATAADGRLAGCSSRTIRQDLSADAARQIAAEGITYVGDFAVTPGDYAVRVVVRDNVTGRIGTVTAPLKVAGGAN